MFRDADCRSERVSRGLGGVLPVHAVLPDALGEIADFVEAIEPILDDLVLVRMGHAGRAQRPTGERISLRHGLDAVAGLLARDLAGGVHR